MYQTIGVSLVSAGLAVLALSPSYSTHGQRVREIRLKGTESVYGGSCGRAETLWCPQPSGLPDHCQLSGCGEEVVPRCGASGSSATYPTGTFHANYRSPNEFEFGSTGEFGASTPFYCYVNVTCSEFCGFDPFSGYTCSSSSENEIVSVQFSTEFTPDEFSVLCPDT